MSSLYTAPEIARRSGASYRQVDYWTTKGWLVPFKVKGAKSGTGTVRVYGEMELAVAQGLKLIGTRGSLPTDIRRAVVSGMKSPVAHGFYITYDRCAS